MSSEYIKKIRTEDGDKQIDYESLANLPDLSEYAKQNDVSQLQAMIDDHKDDTDIHVTATDKQSWNDKASINYVKEEIAKAQLEGAEVDTSVLVFQSDLDVLLNGTDGNTTEAITSDDFVIGGLMSQGGTEYDVANRARSIEISIGVGVTVSILANSNVKWLAHLYENGSWSKKTSFVSTNCFDVSQLATNPSNVTGVRFLVSYTDDRDITNLSDLVGYFTITRTVEGVATEGLLEPLSKIKTSAIENKKIVCFGDSIFGNFNDKSGDNQSITSFIEEKTGATCINVGFGGCKMSEKGDSRWDAFSMERLVDSIASGDWTLQDTAIAEIDTHNYPSYFPSYVTTLKEIDWTTVDIITIAYGTNDYSSDRTIEQFDTALRYSIETILTVYPHIKVVCITPAYRFFDEDGTYLYDCDDEESKNAIGLMLHEYVDKEIATCRELHIDYIDNFYCIGMNKFNRSNYFTSTDGTHPNRNGRQLLAYNIADKLLRY